MTTGVLLPAPVFVAVNSNGVPISGALLQFYATGTTTPATVYADSGLTTPLTNPVVANGDGMFPAVYLDPTVTYRIQWQTPTGGVIADIDPANLDVGAATQAQVNSGTASGVYVSPQTLAGWTGVLTALGYTPLNISGVGSPNGTMSGELQLATGIGPSGDHSAGFRGMPINEQDASYTFVLDDAGKMVRFNGSSAATYTLPAASSVAFPAGTAIVIRCLGSGALTLAAAASGGISLAGQVASGAATRTLAQYGLVTLVMESPNFWIATGVGIT
jgi:hypothetical protein